MAVIAKLNYLRIAPRKVRLVADLIRGKRALEALEELNFVTKRAARPLEKLLSSALANAEHNFGMERANLFISKILVNEGPTLKRWRARARGRFFPINKRSSHVTLVLEQIEKKAPKKKKGIKRPAQRSEVRPPTRKEGKKVRKIKRPGRERRPKPRVLRVPERVKRVFRRKAF